MFDKAQTQFLIRLGLSAVLKIFITFSSPPLAMTLSLTLTDSPAMFPKAQIAYDNYYDTCSCISLMLESILAIILGIPSLFMIE
jgi:hypothetical protein